MRLAEAISPKSNQAWIRPAIALASVSYALIALVGRFVFGESLHWAVPQFATAVLCGGAFLYSRRNPPVGVLAAIGAVGLELSWVLYLAGEVDTTVILVFPVLIIAVGLLRGERWLYAATGATMAVLAILPPIGRMVHGQPPLGVRDWFSLLIVEVALVGVSFFGRTVLHTYRRILEATELSRQRYASLFAHSPDGLIELDAAGRVVEANPVAGGLLPVGGPGRALRDILADARLAGDPAAVRIADGEITVLEFAGEEGSRQLEAVARGLAAPAGHTLLVLRDVTDRRRYERERATVQRLETVGRLAGGIAHEFNNLLTAIGGNAELIRQGPGDDTGKLAESILDSQRRAAELTRNLLSFAQHGYTNPVALSLAKELAEMADVLRRATGSRHRLALRGGTAGWLRADRRQLEQVLIHLLNNARDASPDGGCIEITISDIGRDEAQNLRSPLAAPRQLLVEVGDEGAGMTESVLRRTFEPFFTTKPQGEGVGLGLAAVHGIMAQHGGAVTIDSEPGRGTTVRLFFPEVMRP
jgi:two-component system, cell cycle sensor histidine kinase and response regulator CckA